MVATEAICMIHARVSECWVEIPMETEFKADVLDVYSDSDWAGCKATRKATSGGMLVVDGCCLRSWSSTQATVATRSGEAELYAPVKAAAKGLGFRAVACDLVSSFG